MDDKFTREFLRTLTTPMLDGITKRLNSAAAAAGAKAAGKVESPAALPAGVVLGVRGLAVTSNGDLAVSPAIGSFGPVIEKYPPDSTPIAVPQPPKKVSSQPRPSALTR
jgi:hypothetical protein